MLTVVILGLVVAITGPPVARQIRQYRVGQAANVVAGDLELAFSMAARQRKPMRVTRTGTSYTIADRAGGTVRFRRALGQDSEYQVQSVAFSADPVDVFPSGVATSVDTVTLTSGAAVRRVVMSPAGQVRILR